MGSTRSAFWYRSFGGLAIVGAVTVGAYRSGARTKERDYASAASVAAKADEGASRPAPPIEAASAAEHRNRSLAEVRASGPDKQKLALDVQRLVTGWSAKMSKAGLTARFARPECYAKGCFVTVVQDSEADIEAGTQVITRTGEFIGWQAGKMRTGMIKTADGKVEVTWFLYPPPPGQPALASPLPNDA